MRLLPLLALASTAAVLAACASGPEGSTSSTISADETHHLQSECDARGGILVPTGRNSAYPALDNRCDVTNGSQPPPPVGP